MHGRDAEPIFILGMSPRSGTNFLWDLLCLHPDCGPGRSPVWEDFFLQESDPLVAYATRVRRTWDPAWGRFPGDLRERLLASLGGGLISFLWVERDLRLVTKSPSVRNLDRFFTLFPRACLLLLVRDGRSVVQSCMTTFGWDFDTAARRWAAAADEICDFDGGHRGQGLRYRIVRYEDLVDDVEATMTRILDFVGLDDGVYDHRAAARLPVRGSSVHRGAGAAVHWEPVDKDSGFAPKEHWAAWDRSMHERFEWLAGKQSRRLGYEPLTAPISRPAEVARHRLLDSGWRARRGLRLLDYRARVRLGPPTRPLRRRLGLLRDR